MYAHRKQKGFTLVEVIVVLVILAILAGFMIPAFTNYIQKSRTQLCYINMSQIKREYLAQAAYVAYKVEDEKTLLTDSIADYKATIIDAHSYNAQCGGVITVTYAADKSYIKDMVCSIHGSLSGAVNGLIGTNSPTGYFKELEHAAGVSDYKNGLPTIVDSSSPNGEYISRILTYFSNQGINLDESGIRSWAIYRNVKDGPLTQAIWTDQTIDGLAAGSKVKAIFYNATTNKYTAGYVTVTSKTSDGATYTVFGDRINSSNWVAYEGQTNATQLDYQQTVDIFNQMPATN